jgi:uncharacterized protein (DUF2249 family)
MSAETTPDADRELDVREIDGEPFGDVMSELSELSAGETLLLINSFEPEPLYAVLSKRGFEYETTRAAPDVWYVEIAHA